MSILEELSDVDQQTVLDVIQALKDDTWGNFKSDIKRALDPETLSVYWCVEDFRQRADEREKDIKKKVYNREDFKAALDMMISKHDCSLGITWDTVDVYLDLYCRREFNADDWKEDFGCVHSDKENYIWHYDNVADAIKAAKGNLNKLHYNQDRFFNYQDFKKEIK